MTPPDTSGNPAIPATEFTALAVRLDVRLEGLHEALRDIKEVDLREIKDQVSRTNGRVSKLEIWQATIHGMQLSTRWIPPVVAAVVAAVATRLLG